LSETRELQIEGEIVLRKTGLSPRQLLLPLQINEPIVVPIETQRELEQVLADLLLSVAGTDAEEDGRKLP
jgi:hypothetical protein